AALAGLGWRYASRSQASALRWARVVQTRSGSWAACAALRWSWGGRVGRSRERPSGCPAARDARRRLPSRGAWGPAFPTGPGTRRRADGPPVPLGSLRLALAARYLAGWRGVRGGPGGLEAR